MECSSVTEARRRRSDVCGGRCAGLGGCLPGRRTRSLRVGEAEILDRQFAFDHVDRNGVTFEGNGAVAGYGGEEADKRMHLQLRSKVQGLVDGGIAEAGEGA